MARQLIVDIAGDERLFKRALNNAFADLRRFNSDVQKVNREFSKLGEFSSGGTKETERRLAIFEAQGRNLDVVSAATRRYTEETGRLNTALTTTAERQRQSASAVDQFTGVSIGQAIRLTATFTAASAAIQAVTTAISDSVRLSSEYEVFQTRVGALTNEYNELGDAIAFTNQVTADQNVRLDDVRDSYAKLLPFVNDQLVTTDELRQIFVGLNDVAARSGATNEQLSLAYYGLSQALGSTNVQMQEIRQIFEALPVGTGAFVRALGELTDGAVQTRGDLRDFAAQGSLSADLFVNALLKSFKEFEGAAAELSDTSRASFTRLSNEYTRFLEVLNTDDLAALGADFLTSALAVGRGSVEYLKGVDAGTQLTQTLIAVKRTQDALLESGDLQLAENIAGLVDQFDRGVISSDELLDRVRGIRETNQRLIDETQQAERDIAKLRLDAVNTADRSIIESSVDLAKEQLDIVRDNARAIIAIEQNAASERGRLLAEQAQLQREINNQFVNQVNPRSADTDFERTLEAARQERAAREELQVVLQSQVQLQEQLASLSTARTDEERRTINQQIEATREQLEVQEQAVQKRIDEINALGRASDANVTALDTFRRANALQQQLITAQLEAAKNSENVADGLSDGLEAEAFKIEQQIEELEKLFDMLKDGVESDPLEVDAEIDKATAKLDDLEAQLERLRQPVTVQVNANTPSVSPAPPTPGLATGGFVGSYGYAHRYDSVNVNLALGEAVISAPVVASKPRAQWEALMAGRADIIPKATARAVPAPTTIINHGDRSWSNTVNNSSRGMATGGFVEPDSSQVAPLGSLNVTIRNGLQQVAGSLSGPTDLLRGVMEALEMNNEGQL